MNWTAVMIGVVIGQLILLFFMEEIFDGLDKWQDWKRRFKRNFRWPWQEERRRNPR